MISSIKYLLRVQGGDLQHGPLGRRLVEGYSLGRPAAALLVRGGVGEEAGGGRAALGWVDRDEEGWFGGGGDGDVEGVGEEAEDPAVFEGVRR